ncbi:MAG TPA: autotransporter outer membrane beta-barrel domain-containing protein [Dyella sp.]|nr:autotransporter outer membrane beta-barrel domain-containing protein [Dyella sp.]
MSYRNTFNGLTRRVLVGAVSAALLAPCVSDATSGQQVADGVTLLLAPDDYATTGLPTLSVLNAGNITADGGVTVNASGTGVGAQINGVRSMLIFNGGTISTSGQYGYGLYALAGGAATIGRDASGLGTTINTSGTQASALYGTDAGTTINGTNVNIYTTGASGYGARISGAQLSLTNSAISTTGNYAYGIYADASVIGAASSALTTLTNVGISTQGLSAHAVYLDGSRAGSTAFIDGGNFQTSGDKSVGIYLTQGAQAAVINTRVQTSGVAAYALSMNQDGSSISLDQVYLTTLGNLSDAIWAPNNTAITAGNVTIHTTGNTSLGIDDRASTISLTNGSILTEGSNAHAVYASQEYSSPAVVTGENVDIATKGAGSIGAYARLGARILLTDSHIATEGDQGYGVVSVSGGDVELSNTGIETQGASSSGAYTNAVVGMVGGHIHTSGENAYGVFIADGGRADLSGVDVVAGGVDAFGVAIGGAGGTLNMDGGSVASTQSHAFTVEGNATINLANSVSAIGGSGVLLDVADSSGKIALSMDNNVVAQGDIVFDPAVTENGAMPAANTTVALSNGSHWAGATQNVVSDLSLSSNSLWTLTGDSSVGALALNDATIQFAQPVGDRYKTLVVNGDLSGAGGAIHMNTLLNEGGALGNQYTDRLLVLGNVTTTGTVVLNVTPQGGGALTDTNKDGVINSNEGVSLVQVAGYSRADAFALKNGYIAVGPWRYALYAFGADKIDPTQNALPSGSLSWDYRLANAYVDENGADPNDPPKPDDARQPDVDRAPVRLALAPQLPSYIVAPTALLHYGDTMVDTLHQRLGEIRDATPTDPHGGELFVRYVGSQQRYASNLGFTDYGFGFDQHISAWQLGGSIVSWTGDKSSVRAGFAFDKGTTRVTPNAADGVSASRYDAHGASMWLTWQQANGFYVDAVVGGEHYQGDIDTQARNSAVANLKAGSWTASVEAGYPFAVGKGWSLEPQVQLKHQSLNINDFTDADGLYTQIHVGGLTATRIGVRAAKTDDARLAPYVRADYLRTVGGRSQVTASSVAWDASGMFNGGRMGDSLRLGAGVTSQVAAHLALYGEADYLHGTDNYGLRGWQANVGMRFDF